VSAIPGYSKEFACLQAGMTLRTKIQKVNEYLIRKSKKSGATRKESAAA
jgi:hypothetical protein